MITQKRLKELLHYNPKTGYFKRLVANGGTNIGDIAGPLDAYGYVRLSVENKEYKAHRLAFLYMEGYFPKEVDHEDGIKNNNKWNNLTDITHQDNIRKAKISINNKSGVKGVRKRGSKWHAGIKINNKLIYLGIFENKIDAIKARKQAEYFR